MTIKHIILVYSALLTACTILPTSDSAPECKKRKIATVEQLKQANNSSKQQLLQGKAWVDFVRSLPHDDKNILDELAAISGGLNNLQETGNQYFEDVPSAERFYHKYMQTISEGPMYGALKELRRLRSPSPYHSHAVGDTGKNKLLQELRETVMPCVHKFRPYAIALTLANCLWPQDGLSAPLTTDHLAELWVTGQTDSAELILEKARYLEKAYQIYLNNRDQQIPQPSISHNEILSIVPSLCISALDDRAKIKEELKGIFAIEDKVIEVFKLHMRSLLADDSLAASQAHAALKTFLVEDFLRLESIRAQLKDLAEGKEGTDESIIQILTNRQAVYVGELYSKVLAGTPIPGSLPSPSPSPTHVPVQRFNFKKIRPSEDDVALDSSDGESSSSNSTLFSSASPSTPLRHLPRPRADKQLPRAICSTHVEG